MSLKDSLKIMHAELKPRFFPLKFIWHGNKFLPSGEIISVDGIVLAEKIYNYGLGMALANCLNEKMITITILSEPEHEAPNGKP